MHFQRTDERRRRNPSLSCFSLSLLSPLSRADEEEDEETGSVEDDDDDEDDDDEDDVDDDDVDEDDATAWLASLLLLLSLCEGKSPAPACTPSALLLLDDTLSPRLPNALSPLSLTLTGPLMSASLFAQSMDGVTVSLENHTIPQRDTVASVAWRRLSTSNMIRTLM